MLTLMLLRHAKAVQHGYGDDISRSLTDKGKADAVRLGTWLAARGLRPDLALVSTAKRTTQTFDIVAREIAPAGSRIPAHVQDSLYNATAGQIRDVLRLIDPAVGTLMIVGHNPGIMDAAAMLARDGDLQEIERMRNRFPPGTLALVAFDAEDWLDARAAGGRLDLLILPDDLVAPE